MLLDTKAVALGRAPVAAVEYKLVEGPAAVEQEVHLIYVQTNLHYSSSISISSLPELIASVSIIPMLSPIDNAPIRDDIEMAL